MRDLHRRPRQFPRSVRGESIISSFAIRRAMFFILIDGTGGYGLASEIPLLSVRLRQFRRSLQSG